MWSYLNKYCEEVIGAILLALMASIAFINVLVRYCSSFSFAWSEELTTNFFVWLVLLGTACAFRDGSHLGVSLFYNKLPKVLRVPSYLLSVILCITFFAILAWTGYIEILDEIELERVSDSLELPYWIYTMALPVFSVLIIFRILQRTYYDYKNNKI